MVLFVCVEREENNAQTEHFEYPPDFDIIDYTLFGFDIFKTYPTMNSKYQRNGTNGYKLCAQNDICVWNMGSM